MSYFSDMIEDIEILWSGAVHNERFVDRISFRVILAAYVALHLGVALIGGLALASGIVVVLAWLSGG
jgi:hypothetical protein